MRNLLAICDALDLRLGRGCTPGWWQLLKGLYEIGVEVTTICLFGQQSDSPWWNSAKNRSVQISNLYPSIMKKFPFQRKGELSRTINQKAKPSLGLKKILYKFASVQWKKYLSKVFEQNGSFDAMILFNTPLALFQNSVKFIKKSYQTKVLFYDGDAPVSLPKYWSRARSPTNVYAQADISIYDGVISNSEGVIQDLYEMGAKAVESVIWGVDPSIFIPVKVPEIIDVLFYGHGAEHREKWINSMIATPSIVRPNYTFAVGGNFDVNVGNSLRLGRIKFSSWRTSVASAKINLNITREHHAKIFGSSTSRPFELAMLGSCIVSNPVHGLTKWFKSEKEIFIINNEKEALKTYDYLLNSPDERKRVGEAARARALRDHTHLNRAKQILTFLRSV